MSKTIWIMCGYYSFGVLVGNTHMPFWASFGIGVMVGLSFSFMGPVLIKNLALEQAEKFRKRNGS